MSGVWLTVVVLALATAALKLVGPLTIDARALGVAFAFVALWRRAPMTVVVLGAAAVTALARLLA